MFIELLNQKTPITDTLYLRYDINSFIAAESAGINIFDINGILSDPKKAVEVLKIGLADCFSHIGIDYADGGKIVAKLAEDSDIPAIIAAAIAAALPRPIIGKSKKSDRADNDVIKTLYYRFVDIMGASREEFLRSTLREITERWDSYAEFNGYKKPAERVKAYDDE